MGSDPPTVVLGIMPREGRLKDTAANIQETAVARNPGDGPSWTNLALVCGRLDDPARLRRE